MKRDLGLLFLRLATGGMMFFAHGWGKLVNFSSMAPNFPDPLGIGSTFSLGMAVFAEFFCALALMLGLMTRWVAVPLLITMLVAAFIVHGADPWSKKEFALLYAIPFLTLILTGPGSFALDRFMGRSKG